MLEVRPYLEDTVDNVLQKVDYLYLEGHTPLAVRLSSPPEQYRSEDYRPVDRFAE